MNTRADRRRLLGHAAAAGVAGVAAAAAVPRRAFANTQNPPEAGTGRADPGGRFAGKVVLVTGATSGIGRGTATAFAREGASVVFCGRREALGREAEAEIRGFGGDATFLLADVREEEQVGAVVQGCLDTYGRVHIAFNNAGIETPTAVPLADQSTEDWMDVMLTNARGVFLSMKYELPPMLAQGGGIIINNASVSAHVGFATISPYSASKHAILGLTRCAALEYGAQNIRINSISPGAVDTPMLQRAAEDFGQTFEELAADIPIARINTVEEIARTVMWLASADDATPIHGTDIDVTGGMLTR